MQQQYPSLAFSIFHFAGLGCILVARFCNHAAQHTQILRQVWAKPLPSLSFGLGVIEEFETKMDLEAMNFDDVDDVDKDSSGCMLANNDD
jgi:hypothetical protein